jgi:hypothetical protein
VQLVQLTELRLGCSEVGGVTHEGLMLLTGLSRLQQLTVQASIIIIIMLQCRPASR